MRKQLKEVSDLLHWADSAWMGQENKKQFRKNVRAAVRAVREDDAKVAELHECHNDEDWQGEIAAAIRGRK